MREYNKVGLIGLGVMGYGMAENLLKAGYTLIACDVNPVSYTHLDVYKRQILDQDGKLAEQVPKNRWKKPVILREKCSACSMCVWNCTKDALKIADPSYRGDIRVFAELAAPERCVGCGICESACPLHAIYMKAGEAE